MGSVKNSDSMKYASKPIVIKKPLSRRGFLKRVDKQNARMLKEIQKMLK